jgi:preprotein translocase subunit SecG
MESVLLVIHLIVAVGIIAVILLQPAESGGFLGSSGTMSNLMAPRRGADTITRLTTILACCFFATSLTLAIVASHKDGPKSIMDIDSGKAPVEKTDAGKKSKMPEAPITAETDAKPAANDNAERPLDALLKPVEKPAPEKKK